MGQILKVQSLSSTTLDDTSSAANQIAKFKIKIGWLNSPREGGGIFCLSLPFKVDFDKFTGEPLLAGSFEEQLTQLTSSNFFSLYAMAVVFGIALFNWVYFGRPDDKLEFRGRNYQLTLAQQVKLFPFHLVGTTIAYVLYLLFFYKVPVSKPDVDNIYIESFYIQDYVIYICLFILITSLIGFVFSFNLIRKKTLVSKLSLHCIYIKHMPDASENSTYWLHHCYIIFVVALMYVMFISWVGDILYKLQLEYFLGITIFVIVACFCAGFLLVVLIDYSRKSAECGDLAILVTGFSGQELATSGIVMRTFSLFWQILPFAIWPVIISTLFLFLL